MPPFFWSASARLLYPESFDCFNDIERFLHFKKGYTQTMNNYIVKPLGDMYLEDVTADDIRLASK